MSFFFVVVVVLFCFLFCGCTDTFHGLLILSSSLTCSLFCLDERTISGVDLIKMPLKGMA